MTDEQLLIDRARNGEIEAFRTLVERSRVTTYRLAYDLTGNRQDAEDLSQEAYIRAYRGLAGFRGDAKWSSWLHRITVNVYLDQQRARRDNVEFNEEETHNSMATINHHADPPGPDKRAEAAVIGHHIERALGCLSPAERSVFVMRHYHDLPLKEIAASLAIAEGTVKVHLFRAIRRMQKQLDFFRPELGLEGR